MTPHFICVIDILFIRHDDLLGLLLLLFLFELIGDQALFKLRRADYSELRVK